MAGVRLHAIGILWLSIIQASLVAQDIAPVPAADALTPSLPMADVLPKADVDEQRWLELYSAPNSLPDLSVGTIDSGFGLPGYGYYPLRGRSWVGLDYMLLSVQGQNLPPLAVVPGNVLLGNRRIDTDTLNGLRLRGGHFFDCDGLHGIMVDFFGFENRGNRSGVASPTSGGYRLPFSNMDLSLPSNQGGNGCACLDGPTGTQMTVPLDSISTTSRSNIWSGGIYYRGRIASMFNYCASAGSCCPEFGRYGYRLDGIVGYRYFAFDESLGISGILSPSTGRIAANDSFRTENDFHGVDFGLVYEVDRGRWSFETIGRLGLGINYQQLSISGEGNQGGGIFAQYTNIGNYQHDAVTLIPEVNLVVGYALTPRLRARIGYTFLYLSNVVRPASQIDTRLDGRFFDATQSRPLNNSLAFFPQSSFETESVWLSGLTLGFDYTF